MRTKWTWVILSILVLFFAYNGRSIIKSPLFEWQKAFYRIDHPPLSKVNAIVVLGFSVNHKKQTVSLTLKNRLQTALNLLNEGVSRTLIFTGGRCIEEDPSDPTESEIMFLWFISALSASCKATAICEIPVVMEQFDENNVFSHSSIYNYNGYEYTLTASTKQRESIPNAIKVILETNSTSTRLNAINTKIILDRYYPVDNDKHTLLVVTNSFHQYRAYRIFQRIFSLREPSFFSNVYDSIYHPTTLDQSTIKEENVPIIYMAEAPLEENARQFDFVREFFAIALYQFMGWLH